MSSFFQIPFETPEERSSDLLWPPTRAPAPVFHAPQGAPGELEALDRRRFRSNMVAVGVAGLLVLGSYGLAEGQTAFQCDPQYSSCYPGYGFYAEGGHRGWGWREGGHGGWAEGGHGGWGRGGGADYEAQVGGFGGSGFGGGFGGASAAHGFGGFGGAGMGHGGGVGGG